MVVSRSMAASQVIEGRVTFGTVTLPLQEHIRILGVDLDRRLRFDRHLKHVAHQASLQNDNHQPPKQAAPLDPPEHGRDVAGLVVFHKIQIQGVSHLARQRLPPRDAVRDTRTVLSSLEQVKVPRSRANQHQRTFVSRVSRLWNIFTATVPSEREMSTQRVKVAAHRWRGTLPSPLLV
ncbi:hypothetical protein E2C01_051811 [Portunus trituberculatus]|uniref:Uncharacterized protein n=1 Tax=Portunus trituberculatus TaxID=210409 RepID=A0A5B7GK27_PORTR|nr:hypothetical protein [Portunus trituberculatus]